MSIALSTWLAVNLAIVAAMHFKPLGVRFGPRQVTSPEMVR
jgi:hypothetical protein